MRFRHGVHVPLFNIIVRDEPLNSSLEELETLFYRVVQNAIRAKTDENKKFGNSQRK